MCHPKKESFGSGTCSQAHNLILHNRPVIRVTAGNDAIRSYSPFFNSLLVLHRVHTNTRTIIIKSIFRSLISGQQDVSFCNVQFPSYSPCTPSHSVAQPSISGGGGVRTSLWQPPLTPPPVVTRAPNKLKPIEGCDRKNRSHFNSFSPLKVH